MARARKNIICMLLTMALSALFIAFLVTSAGAIVQIRQSVKHLLPFLNGRNDLLVNITIGIIGSSFVGLISFIIDYRLERKKLMKSIEIKFKNIYYPIITRMANGDLSLMDWTTSHLIYDDAMNYGEEYKPFFNKPAKDNQTFAHILHLLSNLSLIFVANENLRNSQELVRYRICNHQKYIAEQSKIPKNNPAFIKKVQSSQEIIKELQTLDLNLKEKIVANFKCVLIGNLFYEINLCKGLVSSHSFDLQALHDARKSELHAKGIDSNKIEIIGFLTKDEQALLTKVPE